MNLNGKIKQCDPPEAVTIDIAKVRMSKASTAARCTSGLVSGKMTVGLRRSSSGCRDIRMAITQKPV